MGSTDRESKWALITVALEDENPTLDRVSELTGISISEFDARFGVTPIDRHKKLFAVQIRESAIPELKESGEIAIKGPFSNVRIEPLK